MAQIKIKEALDKAIGKKIVADRMELAKALFPDSDAANQRVKIGTLLNGTTKKVGLETVQTICKVLKTDANFLFNVTKSRK